MFFHIEAIASFLENGLVCLSVNDWFALSAFLFFLTGRDQARMVAKENEYENNDVCKKINTHKLHGKTTMKI